MRRTLFAWALAATSCATPSGSAVKGEEDEDTEIEVMTIVAEKCNVPELKTFFFFGTAKIKGGHEHLDKLADCLVRGALRDERLLLIGYTDPTGPDAFNQKLGLWRAQSVGDYLISQGVAASRIDYQSRGPAETKLDPKDYPSHRRVDIRVLL